MRPLCETFPVLFPYHENPLISISELASHNWDLGMRRALTPEELVDRQAHTVLLPSLSETTYQISWPHSSYGRFPVKSLYLKLSHGRPTPRFKGLYRACIPLKIQIFLWQAIRRNFQLVIKSLREMGMPLLHVLFEATPKTLSTSFLTSFWLS